MVKLSLLYTCQGRRFKASSCDTEHFKIRSKYKDGRFIAELDAKETITIQKFQAAFSYEFTDNHKVFVNGYQSWTDSREYSVSEKMTSLNRHTERFIKSPFGRKTGFGRAGDVFFCDFPRETGVFYGWSYGYARNGRQVDLFASLSERNGYTIVRFNAGKSLVIAEKDFEGAEFKGRCPLIDFVTLSGAYDEVFDKYFSMMNISCLQKESKCGYTTWYNYYGNVNEDIVKRDLSALAKLPEKVDIFQIDDGYQKSIGDWLHTDEKKFPSGMKSLADEIHKSNMLAGLWLAPFAAVKDSFIYKNHRDWLIKGADGRPYIAGPNWGSFYAIDFYNKDAAAYIRKVFDTVLNEWDYDMVKLDFLYAACVVPMHNKSRGQIMCEAMDFIRDCVGDKLILGCGVPMMPAFGKVDFCRVGADVGLEWKHNNKDSREGVSTPNTVNCTIFRRHLNGRAFLNDPDVFLLRDDNIKMTFEQRKLLAKINGVFGSLLFVSDNVDKYNAEQKRVFIETIKKENTEIIDAEYVAENIILIQYIIDDRLIKIEFDISSGKLISMVDGKVN